MARSKFRRGGVNLELLNRISGIERTVEGIQKTLSDLKNSRADKEKYGLVKISDATSVTKIEGLALPSREKNASIDGTLANEIELLKNKTSMTVHSSFSSIKLPIQSFEPFIVYYTGADNDAPIKDWGAYWWNGIAFGIPERASQIAINVFGEKGSIFTRQKHDDNWSSWYRITGTIV